VPRPYPREFRDDVVRVARSRDDGVTIEQIAADFGVHPMTLTKWMRQADVDEGAKPGKSTSDSGELRELRRRTGCCSRKMKSCAGRRRICRRPTCREKLYPLVNELAADGIPVAVTCRVLKLARQPYYRWRANPITDAELVEAYRANALFGGPPGGSRVRVSIPGRGGP
jgi:putative transposase